MADDNSPVKGDGATGLLCYPETASEHAVKMLYVGDEEGGGNRGRIDRHEDDEDEGEEEGGNRDDECGRMGF